MCPTLQSPPCPVLARPGAASRSPVRATLVPSSRLHRSTSSASLRLSNSRRQSVGRMSRLICRARDCIWLEKRVALGQPLEYWWTTFVHAAKTESRCALKSGGRSTSHLQIRRGEADSSPPSRRQQQSGRWRLFGCHGRGIQIRDIAIVAPKQQGYRGRRCPARSRSRQPRCHTAAPIAGFFHNQTMFWRLPGPVRSLVINSHRRHCSTTSTRASEPLRILFCGSDHFSIASLRALVEAKRDVPKLIQSIDVLHRPGKPTGRGLKHVREGRPASFCFQASIDRTQYPSSK
jgi:hypothetical protein